MDIQKLNRWQNRQNSALYWLNAEQMKELHDIAFIDGIPLADTEDLNRVQHILLTIATRQKVENQ